MGQTSKNKRKYGNILWKSYIYKLTVCKFEKKHFNNSKKYVIMLRGHENPDSLMTIIKLK